MKLPAVWGHRGTRRGAPENTLHAMRMALDQGAAGIELDVRLCGSGEVIVLHDVDLVRMAGAAVKAEQASLAELRRHDLGGGERVPLLDDALDLVLARGATLNVELKPDVPDRAALVSAVAERLSARAPEERARILLSSFAADICEAMHAALPTLRTAFLYEHTSAIETSTALPRGVSAVHPLHTLVDASVVARFHAQGLAVNVWTVNDPARVPALVQAGVDVIITDDVPAISVALRAP